MTASLPMYWWPENAAAWTRFWQELRSLMPELPPITAPEDLPSDWYLHWGAPDLKLSHVCGLPFASHFLDQVTYVASFDFDLPDTPAGWYHSVVVTRRGEIRPREELRLAYNSADSQSGWGSTRGHPFAGYLATGAHRESAAAVADGRADVAYIDAVSWRILSRMCPAMAEPLEAVARTTPTPGLALIAARGIDPDPLRAALGTALERLGEEDRFAMGGPVGLAVLPTDSYRALPIPAPVPA
ncbi:PhnD/SsuA/transferrin family substrate-binding protein [Mameliella alba]|nr:PhnD/SsuA/transferrin family substrate-binding protein [Antarctobacter heliothermus]MBY6147098.1 PhnD/SsuA/transferrin family substrate-binding protein [Mameliella alba]MBY6161954.1 PhnD/SsuA/transferrin family substrate-binding protein [Mameliella alba]MBY6170424.1 PhnD/SsuA/transferrin family substrate-binding protein [Mameliella alba]MBY6175442.1 PhnD/SsuA/transferrin family substrate-binding protein [Mameliella alba]